MVSLIVLEISQQSDPFLSWALDTDCALGKVHLSLMRVVQSQKEKNHQHSLNAIHRADNIPYLHSHTMPRASSARWYVQPWFLCPKGIWVAYTICFMIFVFFLSFFSPPRTPVKVVPQIRIELDPEDSGFFWRSKGTETTL
ncbi:hypothetical protein lerEdw1_002467 [Lerista edwardsae]|nr:hypothetical protein lerEdw1_002467 [Lerista edwardsae]